MIFLKITELNQDFFKYFLKENESHDEFLKTLHKDSSFLKNNSWLAIVIVDECNRPHGRVLLTFPANKKFCFFGYFESSNEHVAKALFGEIDQCEKIKNYNELRGPVNFNIFNHSRIRLDLHPQIIPGDPKVPYIYNDFFIKSGLKLDRVWKTIKIPRIYHLIQFVTGYLSYRSYFKNIKVKRVDFNHPIDGEKYLNDLYLIVKDSYQSLPDFTSLDFDEYKIWCQNDLKSFDKKLSFIAYEHDLPVAFLLAKEIEGLLYIIYLGKIKNTENRIKGITAPLGLELIKSTLGFFRSCPVLCYIADHSPTYKILPKVGPRELARHGIYSKNILKDSNAET